MHKDTSMTKVRSLKQWTISFLKKSQQKFQNLQKTRKPLQTNKLSTRKAVSEHAKVLDKFVTEHVAKEVKELRADRIRTSEHVTKLDDFVAEQLAEELNEFHEDKKALVEQKVKMVREGKKQLAEAKKDLLRKRLKKSKALSTTFLLMKLNLSVMTSRQLVRTTLDVEFLKHSLMSMVIHT